MDTGSINRYMSIASIVAGLMVSLVVGTQALPTGVAVGHLDWGTNSDGKQDSNQIMCTYIPVVAEV